MQGTYEGFLDTDLLERQRIKENMTRGKYRKQLNREHRERKDKEKAKKEREKGEKITENEGEITFVEADGILCIWLCCWVLSLTLRR